MLHIASNNNSLSCFYHNFYLRRYHFREYNIIKDTTVCITEKITLLGVVFTTAIRFSRDHSIYLAKICYIHVHARVSDYID